MCECEFVVSGPAPVRKLAFNLCAAYARGVAVCALSFQVADGRMRDRQRCDMGNWGRRKME